MRLTDRKFVLWRRLVRSKAEKSDQTLDTCITLPSKLYRHMESSALPKLDDPQLALLEPLRQGELVFKAGQHTNSDD
jgi:hypothetical protein